MQNFTVLVLGTGKVISPECEVCWVKLDAVLTKVRHRCGISSKGAALPAGAMTQTALDERR